MSDTNYHVGYPPPPAYVLLDRVARGLPVYLPRDPRPIEQTEYIRFAQQRGPNDQ